MKLTAHFSVWDWADFTRGVAEEKARAAMNMHLSQGCRRCEALVRVLRGFQDVVSREANYAIPERALRRAEAIAARRFEPAPAARLVYDSFREPLLAGLRAHDRLARHVSYEAGDLFVDLQLQQEPGSEMVTLLGQLMSRNPVEGAAMAELPVFLMAPKGPVTSAICNPLGEFEMRYRPVRHLRLHVPAPDGLTHLEVRMDEVAPAAGRKPRVTRRADRQNRRARGTSS